MEAKIIGSYRRTLKTGTWELVCVFCKDWEYLAEYYHSEKGADAIFDSDALEQCGCCTEQSDDIATLIP